MCENPRRGRQARNFTTNVPKILDLKSSSEQIFSKNWRLINHQCHHRSETKQCPTSNKVQIMKIRIHFNLSSVSLHHTVILKQRWSQEYTETTNHRPSILVCIAQRWVVAVVYFGLFFSVLTFHISDGISIQNKKNKEIKGYVTDLN